MAKKYFWLKLKQDFFNNLRMKKLRSIAGGDTYTIIYLKMQLLSLQNEGILYYEGVEESFEQEIALLIDENIEDVRITINFLKTNNLLNEIQDGEYELVETKTCIGSETDKAEFMRRLRQKKEQEKLEHSNIVTNMLPSVTNCYTEKEKEKDIDKEKEIDVAEITKCYEENIGLLTPATAELLFDYLDNMDKDLIIKAIKIATINNKRTGRYIQGILNDWNRKGIRTLLDAEKEEQEFKNKNKQDKKEETFEEQVERYKREWGVEDED